MNKLQIITDFTIWLLFVTSILLTITLSIAGTYKLITNPSWGVLMLFVAALVTLGMHYIVRSLPVQGGKK